MQDKYEERKQYVEERKPYWMNLRAPRDGEMYWDLNNYFPDAHYRKAIDEYCEEDEPELRTDGGSRTQYYWSGDDGILYHGEKGDDMVLPFFDSVEDAERFLERQADQYGTERYNGMVLRKTGNRKVEEATDVLTDQSGLADFAPDGGYPVDATEPPEQDRQHQIDNPQPDTVWFWYNPSMDSIVQEEVEPYDVRGVFESEDDAHRFLDWYADQYDLDDTSHLELYSADIDLEGFGRKYLDDTATESDPDGSTEPPEQAELGSYTHDNDDDDDPDVMADGGVSLPALNLIKATRASSDPIVLHGPTAEYAPPKDDPVYSHVLDSRLEQVGESSEDHPVKQASVPETMLYLHTLSFDGRYDAPQLEEVYRETFRNYVDGFTPYDPDQHDTPAFEDPELDPELDELLQDLRRAIKMDRDVLYLSQDEAPAEFASVYEADPERETSYTDPVIDEFKLD